MKKIIIFGLLLLIGINGWGQKQQKSATYSFRATMDRIYGSVQNKIDADFLLNRTMKDTMALTYQARRINDTIANANWFYTIMQELRIMARDTSNLPNPMQLFNEVSTYNGKKEFENNREVYPIGIIDYHYYWLKEKESISQKIKEHKKVEPYTGPIDKKKIKREKVRLITPLFNYGSMDNMGLIFRRKDFYSNIHKPSDIKKIELKYRGIIAQLTFGKVFNFQPEPKKYQQFSFKVYFKDGDSIVNKAKILTPELAIENSNLKTAIKNAKPNFDYFYKVKIGKFKLKAFVVPSCSNEGDTMVSLDDFSPPIKLYIPRKPYIIVPGYRPPLASTGPNNIWKRYNTEHGNLLDNLRKNGYDIVILKFNQAVHPQTMGISEKADLLIEYIQHLNDVKAEFGYDYNENVFQGCSSGNSVIRLALLKMEKKHLHNNNYPHHHSRLFISYDANYYGANIPLAYQMQIYSGLNYFNLLIPGSLFLKFYLHGVLEQKATKQLLMYHAKGMGNEDFFDFPVKHKTWVPTYASERQDYLNTLNSIYNGLGYYPHGKLFTPIPSATRNISISLGHYKTPNYNTTQNLDFNSPGEAWRYKNIWLYKNILRAAQYSNSGKLIFKRFLFSINMWGIPSVVANEELKVKNMQDIDGASGSYLKGVANVLALTNLAYGFNWNNTFSKPKFTHKSVLSGLAINKSYWPSNGSHTLNLQATGLMFNQFGFDWNDPNDYSDYYGYPNLGRPNDHWDITPFEAIYCSNFILPHINYSNLSTQELNNHIDPINEFIANEVEPCYLYLQNQHLGAQARSNYTYKARRRANNVITTGHLVTPKTDPGDYVVEPNADLILEAGEEISLKPGTHIKSGAKAHLWIHYEKCDNVPRPCDVQGLMTKSNSNNASKSNVDVDLKIKTNNENQHSATNVRVFPNPTSSAFTVIANKSPITDIKIYSIGGKHIKTISTIRSKRYAFKEHLPKGLYLLKIQDSKGNFYHKKIIVL